MTSVTFPQSLTTIGYEAFRDCNGLTSVSIPENVTQIEGYAFEGCNNLKKLYFNAIDCSTCGTNGAPAFSKSMEEVIIGDNVKTIPPDAFYYCSGLKLVQIPASVTTIGKGAFKDCSNLTNVDILGGLTTIGQEAFSNCSSLKEFIIPSTVTSLGSNAFSGCRGLVKAAYPSNFNNPFPTGLCISYKSDLKNIDGCIYSPLEDKLYYVTINTGSEFTVPETVTEIANYAFAKCTDLKSVIFPNTVTKIGNKSFSGCSSLTDVVLPKNLATLGSNVWMECENISKVVYLGEQPVKADDNIFEDAVYNKATLYVPNGKIEAFRNSTPWGLFKNIEEDATGGVAEVAVDFSTVYEVYNLNGVKVGNTVDGLPAGIYIVSQGTAVTKVAVK